MAGISHTSPLGVAGVTEDISPTCRPSLRGVSRVIPEDSSVRRKLVDEREHIVLSAACASAFEVASDSGSGAKTVRKDVSFAAVVRGVCDVATAPGSKSRVRSKPGSAIPPGRTVHRGIRKMNSAAVLISCDEGGPSYVEVMGEARSNVSLEELGITDMRVRRAQTGDFLVEIPGEDAESKADSLVSRLNSLFKDQTGIKVVWPIRRVEFRLLNLNESVMVCEIAEAVATHGNVQSSDVGPLRPDRGGLNTAPDSVRSHVRIRYRKMDFALAKLVQSTFGAFGQEETPLLQEHTAIDCKTSPHCPVCAERNLPAGHRAGRDGCVPYNSPIRTATSERADNSDRREESCYSNV
ncbi:PREDICTED: uncharacterized protein LOC105148596 [Acromyrmex echinatior]|uniref:uncharacterized protein LOC105148596 n=1 Tax=Acromyrmex echinatior TaxID=103372 RepID=UPI0005810AEF|nr:PREDICTED: uncharacterized protein LOC105148596 [Acromyrmex echinatior]